MKRDSMTEVGGKFRENGLNGNLCSLQWAKSINYKIICKFASFKPRAQSAIYLLKINIIVYISQFLFFVLLIQFYIYYAEN